jgi:hypothetical protein
MSEVLYLLRALIFMAFVSMPPHKHGSPKEAYGFL